MTAIVDTSFLFALTDSRDVNHQRAVDTAAVIDDLLISPITVLPEICYLIESRLGHAAMRRFINTVAAGDLQVESVSRDDLSRVTEILNQYADARVDFVDATIVALAERLKVTRILTLDRRHFELFRPQHCAAFEIFP
ncbi:MAG: PIN domain-containing protein [Anaerolineales bacterium]|nr:MAG: PIN domain-containing protein [Anaerolineales bacterium]